MEWETVSGGSCHLGVSSGGSKLRWEQENGTPHSPCFSKALSASVPESEQTPKPKCYKELSDTYPAPNGSEVHPSSEGSNKKERKEGWRRICRYISMPLNNGVESLAVSLDPCPGSVMLARK